MANWRCPHCRTPQPEAARCWVCRRSSTSCGTCAHYRRAIAGPSGGTCGLDPRRTALQGDELRGCWRPIAITPGRSEAGVQIPVIDPAGPPFPAPGTLWSKPEA